ncbi:T9SS type A sorting domain-containing protein [Epilithonimonas pallida]|uniref:Por secretion system C-terminal sorting domain-containing protein n=1 Tax=Epilithonimonas pallida TaxID=373671 RepID=A0ABY1QZE9_9FLAO|nr:T9SS type A sorting domain-containing protein [Epilithonimonas pallida]SMP90467.1 Por secretion system C-terminal sorting domain-containing protein [Epilithonimonas pallida]
MKKILLLFTLFIHVIFYSQWIKLGLDKKNVTSISTNEITPTIFAVADGALYKSSNHGDTWNLLSLNNSGTIYYAQIDKINESVYIGTSRGIYKSVDNGISFNPINNGLPNNFGIYPSVSRILVTDNELIINVSGSVYKTDKNVINWTNIQSNLSTGNITDIDFYNNVYYLTFNSQLYSKVGNGNWELITTNPNWAISALTIQNNSFFVAVYNGCGSVIHKSNDFGQTWTNISPYVHFCSPTTIFGYNNVLYLGGTYGGYSSGNYGQDWSVTTPAIIFEKYGNWILAGRDYNTGNGEGGAIYRYFDTNLLSTNEIDFKEIIYPVPTKDYLYISNQNKENKTVSIFNLEGKKVIENSSKDSKISLNLTHLPKGVYIVEILTNRKKTTQKIIKE